MKAKEVVKKVRRFAEPFRITNGKKFHLKDVNPGETLGFKSEAEPRAKEALADGVRTLAELQDKLYAQDKWAVLLTFQALGATTVSNSQQQAQLLTFFVNPPITLLSGATSPIENMPNFLQRLSYLDPLRFMVTTVRGVTLKNAPWSALWPNLVILAVFAVILFSISAWRFRKQ
jgi:ABC-2 type transporter